MDPPEATVDKPHFLDGKTILVSGAGIAGLAFALAIHSRFDNKTTPVIPAKPRVIIFERDSYEERVGREGYTLAIRTENNAGGGQVLDLLGLYDQVKSVSVHGQNTAGEGGCFNVWDAQFRPFVRLATEPVGPRRLTGMRIRRNALQKVLAQAATDAGAEIRWETTVTEAQSTDQGGIQVSLSDGSTVRGDILIAADGSRSKLRSLLRPDHDLDYAGVYCWSGIAKYADQEAVPPPVNQDWGLVIGGKEGVGLFVSPVDQTSALWSFSCRSIQKKEPHRPPLPQKQLDELMEMSTEMAASLSPVVNNLVSATDPSTVMAFNAMDRQPFSHSPDLGLPVVYIGDANHAVSPFAGAGANLALMDACDLAAALKEASSLEEALTAYDKVALPRASRILKMSRWTIDVVHATGIKMFLYKLLLGVLGFLVRRRPGVR